MDPQERELDRARVAHLMTLMAAGVADAMLQLVVEFRPRLDAAVRRQLVAFGRRDVIADPSQFEYLVLSAALVIFDRAAGWDVEGGAMPWTWAERAIRAEVVRVIGHPSIEFDPGVHEASEPPSFVGSTRGSATIEPAPGAMYGTAELDGLADRDDGVALLRDAIATVGSPRDQAVHIQYGIQKRLGDSSPAHTVAAEFGLAPDNVRQIDHRMRGRLRRLAERDNRFVSLLGFAWLAA